MGAAVVKKTHAWLADGREIVYFDESDDAVRVLVDERRLPPRPAAPFMRFDVLTGEWVAVAAHRQDRTYLPPDELCPLCPSVGGHRTEIPSSDYDVVVFENRFPSFLSPPPPAPPTPPTPPAPADRQAPALGRCEVVCFTPAHNSSFSRLSERRVATVMEAWVDRTRALSELPQVAQVFCFENRGPEIGVTLRHPHGQIYGYPFVAPRTIRVLAAARQHWDRTGRNLFADVLAAEVGDGRRIVAGNEDWTAFVPYAARWPLEVHVYPNRGAADLRELDEAQRRRFGPIYLDVLRRLESVHGADLPYVAAWHQAPVRGDRGRDRQPDRQVPHDRDLAYLHLEITSPRRAPGKLKHLAGSETAMGAFINDVVPEEAARALRDQRP